MHILAMLVGVITLVSVWYWRMKVLGDAAREIGDAAGRMRGVYKRAKFLRKVDASTLTAIDDPALAAAVLLVCIGEQEQPLTEAKMKAIERWLREVAQTPDPVEALVFAKWAAAQSTDPAIVMKRLLPLWKRTLNQEQRNDLIEIGSELASDLEPHLQQSIVRMLGSKLAF